MKKLVAVVLALVLALSMVCMASAEQRTYLMVGALDADGNIAVVDETSPVFILVVDDEAMTCAFGTKVDETENVVEGTIEITEDGEEEKTIVATLTNGETVTIVYEVADDMFIYVEEDVAYVLMNLDTLAADAA